MTFRSRTHKLLSILLPIGALGISAALASAHAKPAADNGGAAEDTANRGVAARLQAIRSSVSTLEGETSGDTTDDPRIVLAQFLNIGGGGVGWRNGGWGNAGGWRNGGWGNAGPWRNGGWVNAGPWRNGGWRNNWGNGGWHNFWRNW